jgi:hypothetical protein
VSEDPYPSSPLAGGSTRIQVDDVKDRADKNHSRWQSKFRRGQWGKLSCGGLLSNTSFPCDYGPSFEQGRFDKWLKCELHPWQPRCRQFVFS